jgi:hypothetical protein
MDPEQASQLLIKVMYTSSVSNFRPALNPNSLGPRRIDCGTRHGGKHQNRNLTPAVK